MVKSQNPLLPPVVEPREVPDDLTLPICRAKGRKQQVHASVALGFSIAAMGRLAPSGVERPLSMEDTSCISMAAMASRIVWAGLSFWVRLVLRGG